MDFTKNYEIWHKLFKGDVPQGKEGNSPASFHRSELFVDLGALK